MKYFFTLILASLMLLVGCISTYRPVPKGNIEISDDFAILRTENELLAVRVDFWSGEPQYLTEYFDIMFIRIQNRTRESYRIEPTDFALIDENLVQYDLVPHEIVLEIALAHPSLVPEWFATTSETQRENLNRVGSIRRNIMTRAFSFGEIHQGVFKEGMLFFPKLDSKNQEFTFLYKNHEIDFRKSR